MKLNRGATASVVGLAFATVMATSLTACADPEMPSADGVIKISYSEEVASNLPLWIALDAGYFEDEGLDVELVMLESDLGYPALISGQTQLASMGGTQVVSGSVAGGDVKVLASLAPVFPYELYANVDSAEKLKGKRVGYTSKSGSQYVGTVEALKKLGLKTSDVNLVSLGSVTNVNNALLSKTIDAATTHPPASLQFDDAGLNMLIDLAEQKLPNINVGISSTSAYMKEHPDVIEKVMAGVKKGLERTRTDKEYALKILGKEIGVKNKRELDATWEYYTSEVFPEVPHATEEQLETSRQSLVGSVNGVEKVDLSKLIDSSFVDKVYKDK